MEKLLFDLIQNKTKANHLVPCQHNMLKLKTCDDFSLRKKLGIPIADQTKQFNRSQLP